MIAIIKYGAGNTRSVMNALDRLQVAYELTDDADKILSASKVVFPGVGHANHAMQTLKSKGLDQVIREVKNPLLGICVGMQLLFEGSEEGQTDCLGIIKGIVKKFDEEKMIVPQIGWNTIQYENHPLFAGLDQGPWFYSIHSYYAEVGDYTLSTSSYGIEYSSTVRKNNFYGTQYHPEKSSNNGHIVLKNFLKL